MFYKFIFVITRPGSSRQFFRVWKGTVLLLSGQMCGFREFNVLMTQNLLSHLIFAFVFLYFTGFWSTNLKPACKNSLLMPPISASQLLTIFRTGAFKRDASWTMQSRTTLLDSSPLYVQIRPAKTSEAPHSLWYVHNFLKRKLGSIFEK